MTLQDLADDARGGVATSSKAAATGSEGSGGPASLSRDRGHQTPAPAGAKKPVPIHKALADFSVMLGPQLITLKQGQLIEDPGLIGMLKEHDCPIGPVTDALRHRCPQCGMVSAIEFTAEDVRKAG